MNAINRRQDSEPSISPYVRSLRLQNFRNYDFLTLAVDARPVVLTGDNGAGKTNLLEALSLLSPGRGMRKSKLLEFHRLGGAQRIPWAASFQLIAEEEITQISTGSDPDNMDKRVVKIDGAFKPQKALQTCVDVIWQTPQMDRLFIDGRSVRLKFLDQMVEHKNKSHRKHLSRYEHVARERLKLLKEGRGENAWLEGLEHIMSAESIAIIADRQSFVAQLNQHCLSMNSSFPKARGHLEGEIESWLDEKSALEVEEALQRRLYENRRLDQQSGMTNIGAHQSNLCVYNLDFDRPAEVSSTGEQKALLLSLIMAQSRLLVSLKGAAPIVLLDEVVAHLDRKRRYDLFDEIFGLRMQAWMTGTDALFFEEFENRAQFLDVVAGHVLQST